MDRSKALAASAVALSFFGLIEKDTAFVPVIAKQTPALRAGGLRATLGAESQATQQAGAGFRTAAAAAALACGAACMSARRSTKRAPARTVVWSAAKDSDLMGRGPIVVYTDALMKAAAQKGESVQVAKDVMKMKQCFVDEDFKDKLQLVNCDTETDELGKAKGMLELLQPLDSTVMPSFIIFLGKKKRLAALKIICKEFITVMYDNESISPVTVRSAQRLTEEQLDSLKIKMKEKTGAADIKLIQEVDASLLGGFVVEWGYPDPEDLTMPTEGVDLSLSNILRKQALNNGVLVEV